MAISQTQLEQLYLAYFGRPADFDGLVFYTSNPNFDIWSVAAAFSASPESQALYGTGVAPNFISAATINAIYQNLFNRDAEPAGLSYWAGEVASGRLSAAGAAYGILLGAQNDDAIAVANKLAASAAFTAALDTSSEIIGYAGDDAAQAARDWLATVTADPATLTAALAGVDAAVEAVTNGGVISGETVNLTTGLDDITFSALNTADIVKGYFDGGTGDTLTVADAITGNGHTILEVAVDAGGGAVAAPYFAGSGIEGLHVIAAGTGWATFDATNIGTALSDITLSGTDGLTVCVTSMDATGDVNLSIAGAATGTICASGALNGADLSMCLYNSDTDDVGGMVSVGTSGMNVALGKSDAAWLSITDNQGGSLAVGDVNAALAGDFCFYIANSVSKTGAGGTATVGDLTVGNVNVDVSAAGGYFSGSFCNYAYTAKGAATVGNVVIGDVDIHVAKGGDQTWWAACNSASSDKGSATAGNFTVGNVTVTADKGAGYNMYTSFYNYAYADTGNATVGNMSIGAITMVGGDALEEGAWFGISQSASVSGAGNATVGSLTVGDISLTAGNNAAGTPTSNCMCFGVYADADKGAATIGDVTFGDVTFNVGDNNDFSLTICASAYVSGTAGAATVGDVTIGNITGDVGLSGDGSVCLVVCASGAAADSIGNITVGNVDMYGSAEADLALEVCAVADQGSVGNVTIGTIDQYVENDASASIEMCVCGDSVGDIAIGDVTLTLGTSSSMDTFSIEVYADDGDIGNVSLGNITLNAAKCAYDDDADICFCADGNIGNVTVGNVMATAGISATFTSMFDMCFSADNGVIGNMTFGDISFDAAKNASISQYIGVSAEDGVGDVTIGDVTLLAAGTAADLSVCFCAWVSDDIGNVTVGDLTASAGKSAEASICVTIDNSGAWGDISVGNIDASAIGKNAYAWVGLDYSSDDTDDAGDITIGSIDAHASKTGAAACVSLSFTSFENIGTVAIGDISMSAAGKGNAQQWIDIDVTADQDIGAITVGDITIAESGGKTGTANWAGISLCFDAGDEMGAVTVGDVTMTLSNAVSATVDAVGYFTLDVYATTGGNTTVGDITVSAAEVASGTAGYVFETATVSADFNIYSDGNLVIGDITVSDGGYEGFASMADTSAAVLDNFGTLTTWLDLSVAGGKTITVGAVDYSGYQGTATIDVSDWKGAGAIVAAQDDTTIYDNKTKNVITLGAGDDTVVLDEGATTDESAEANIDQIVGFVHGKDTIEIDTTSAASATSVKTTGLADYAAFLAWAQTTLATGDDVAIGIVGGDTYVAIDKDNGSAIDFVVKLTGVTNVDETDFSIY